MSLMHAHIRAQRAFADALCDEVDHLLLEAPGDNALLAKALRSMANAHRAAAERLHKEEMEILEHAISQ